MCNFNNLEDSVKSSVHTFLSNGAVEVGGVNFLLALVESIKKQSPHALMLKECKVASQHTIIRWNKVIFRDKVALLSELLKDRDAQENVIEFSTCSDKERKNIINMIRTLSPLEFTVAPQNHKDGEGFSFKVFNSIEDTKVELNPIFVALFFCSAEFCKKALKYRDDS